jgi:hypothetical protein
MQYSYQGCDDFYHKYKIVLRANIIFKLYFMKDISLDDLIQQDKQNKKVHKNDKP